MVDWGPWEEPDSERQWSLSRRNVVVGRSPNNAGESRGFRWTQGGGMVDLGTLEEVSCSTAYGVSADGSAVVGYSLNNAGTERAFRWK